MTPTLTIADAASLLGLCEKSVRMLVASGRLRCYRLGFKGGKIRISPEDVAEYVASCRDVQPARQPAMALRFLRPQAAARQGRDGNNV